MKVLVVDMTHGGTVIASEFSKIEGFEVFALDIYKTLTEKEKALLIRNGVKLVKHNFLEELNRDLDGVGLNEGLRKEKSDGTNLGGRNTGKTNLNEDNNGKIFKTPASGTHDLWVVSPVHCNFESEIKAANKVKIRRMTHHEAVGFLLKNRIKVPIIEVTGVKGKTSVVWMLKEIFKDLNPLILSSLGVELVEDKKNQIKCKTSDETSKNLCSEDSPKGGLILKENISITPASIIEAFKLVNGCETLQECSMNDEVGICIFEISLGGTGLADVGVLTNIAENYPIAGGKRKASQAKAQIFKSKTVTCDYRTFNTFYSDNRNPDLSSDAELDRSNLHLKEDSNLGNMNSDNSEYVHFNGKTNTFGFEEGANVRASDIDLGIYKTTIQIVVEDLKTIKGRVLNTSFEVSTFAPAKYHVQNVLAAICTSLTLEMPLETIKRGLKGFRGVKGRTSITNYRGSKLIEEINPGLNVIAVKNALDMVTHLEEAGVIFGGEYGITCEEIDENSVANVLNDLESSIPLILVDELGNNVKDNIKRRFKHFMGLTDAVNWANKKGCLNILIIYRSNFSDLNLR